MLMITPRSIVLFRGALAAADEAQRRKRVSLAGAAVKPQKLNRQRFERLLDATIKIMKTRSWSKFEFEGACRSGIRAGLCLEGWRWPHADLQAVEIVETALNRIGAVRPRWDEGQPEYVIEGLVERTRCVHCARAIPEERTRPNVKYCGGVCAKASIKQKQIRSGERLNMVEYLAAMSVKSNKTLQERSGNCEVCGTFFLSDQRDRRFCSQACKKVEQVRYPPRPCDICSAIYKPKMARAGITRTCSVGCGNELRRRTFAAIRLPPRETACKTCATIFTSPRSLKPRNYCSAPCNPYASKAQRRSILCEEITS